MRLSARPAIESLCSLELTSFPLVRITVVLQRIPVYQHFLLSVVCITVFVCFTESTPH